MLGGFALAIVIPIMVVMSTSLASDRDIIDAGGYVLWPSHPTLKAYETLFSGGLMGRAIMVSVFVTVVGTAIALAVTIALAYATSRPVLFGRPVLLMVLFTLLFAPGIIPMFLVVKQLGLIDSLWSLILPGALGAFNFVVTADVLHERAAGAAGECADRRGERLHHPAADRDAVVEGGDRGGRAVLRGRVLERVLQRAAVSERHRRSGRSR